MVHIIEGFAIVYQKCMNSSNILTVQFERSVCDKVDESVGAAFASGVCILI